MTDTITDFLERAEKAKGDPQIQAALTAEFALAAYAEPERSVLRASLDAAALLHWFGSGLLAQLLELSADEALKRFEALKSLSFVERYRQGAIQLYNVHEATRLGWRRQLAGENPDRFRSLSLRAAACFAEDPTPIGRREHIYLILCCDPELDASGLVELDRQWQAAGTNPENFGA